MKKSIGFGLFLAAIILVLALVACGTPGSAIVGRWGYDVAGTADTADDIIFEFRATGTCTVSMESYDVTYDMPCTLTSNSITITDPDTNTTATSGYSVSGNVLTLTDPDGTQTQMNRVP